MRRVAYLAGLAIACLTLPSAAGQAHHSYAMFDMTKSVELKGVVDQFKWTNPHAWLVITVKDKSGAAVAWNVEMTSPNNLPCSAGSARRSRPATR